MAREATITLAQVAAAATKIKAEGRKPTVRAVREELGGIGSMTTITRLLQEWMDDQPEQPTTMMEVPSAVIAAISQVLTQTRSAAQAEVMDDLTEARHALAAVTREAERTSEALNQAEARIVEMEGRRADAAARLEDERQARQDAAAEAARRIQALEDQVSRERTAAEVVRTELAKTQLRLESLPRLESELDACRRALSDTTAKAGEAERDLAAARAELAAVREALARERDLAVQAAARADAELATVRKALDKAEARADAERERCDGMTRQVAKESEPRVKKRKGEEGDE